MKHIFEISNLQLKLIEKLILEKYINIMIQHYKQFKMPQLPENDLDIKKMIIKRINEARKWEFRTIEQIETYIYLCFSYTQMNENVIPKKIARYLKLTEVNANERLELIHLELIKENLNIQKL